MKHIDRICLSISIVTLMAVFFVVILIYVKIVRRYKKSLKLVFHYNRGANIGPNTEFVLSHYASAGAEQLEIFFTCKNGPKVQFGSRAPSYMIIHGTRSFYETHRISPDALSKVIVKILQ